MKLYVCPDCTRDPLPLMIMTLHMMDEHGWLKECRTVSSGGKIMREVTDNTIDILCAECSQDHIEHYESGIKAMIAHVLERHHEYSQLEADAFATAWMESAYDKIDEQDQRLSESYQHEKRHRAFWGQK